MILKVAQESETGLNTKFINKETGRSFSLEHVLDQIDRRNPNYSNYEKVTNSKGTTYVRSKPDGNISNNIE